MKIENDNYLEEPILWSRNEDPEFPYHAVYDGHELLTRLNDFPDDHLFSLLVDNEEVADFDDWPIKWIREDYEDNIRAAQPSITNTALSDSVTTKPMLDWELLRADSIEHLTTTLLQVIDHYSSPHIQTLQPAFGSMKKWLNPVTDKEQFYRPGNPAHIEILSKGVTAWNEWRLHNPSIQPDLSGVNLTSAQLTGINLSRTFLIGTSFEKADLTGARLDSANLSAATLREANLRGALLSNSTLTFTNFDFANLDGAFLAEAKCFRTSFLRATLVNALLTESSFYETDLSGADLRECRFGYSRWVSSKFRNANLSNCQVHGLTAFNIDLSNALQSNLSIGWPGEPNIWVDNIDFAQFLLVILQTEFVHEVVSSISSRIVLIIGNFIPARESVLNTVREELRSQNYSPVVVQFEKRRRDDEPDKIAILSRLAKFIIADLGDAHEVTPELRELTVRVRAPIQPIFQSTEAPKPGIQPEIDSPLLLPSRSYRDADDLALLLRDRVIAEAEAKAHELVSR